ncbi:carbohydrate ABC transporter permease [Haloplasma contractile]|uniref:L-arabinose transport system permease protein AraQ n=1 Tax=Haloplasma contractile SSD-17B TaxID=1033810 RepID=F7PWG5_9MOLU|nr:carbohydrate ABC transporter permease [Haloplasma contractile]ERJ11885.1 L-arabinose transport system permease protein AraQ [Haloplasma contractile SSD-17B]
MHNDVLTNQEQQIKAKKTIVYFLIYFFLGLLALITITPFIMILINSTRSGTAIRSGFTLIPGNQFMENWNVLMDTANILRGFLNSLFISLSVTILSGYFSALTAYGFYVYKFRGRNFLFIMIIVMMMVPQQLAFLGFYELMSGYGLIDTYYPLIIPAIASTFTVFFLRSYAAGTVHKELIEASRIDGAREFSIFHRLGLPLMMPGIATMSIFTFIGAWNNYLGALIILNSPEKKTLPLMIAELRTSQDIWIKNQGALYVGLAVSIVPIVIAFMFFSRYIIDSIASGAVKG